jgi:hypothetical protein
VILLLLKIFRLKEPIFSKSGSLAKKTNELELIPAEDVENAYTPIYPLVKLKPNVHV